MDIVFILLRLIHIFSGVFWAGTAMLLAGFVMPAVQAAGPSGQTFTQKLLAGRYSSAIGLAAMISTLAGLLLYVRDFSVPWLTSPSGLAFTLGGLAGLLAAGEGAFVISRRSARLVALQNEIEAANRPPSEAQRAELQDLGTKLRRTGARSAILLALTVALMALGGSL